MKQLPMVDNLKFRIGYGLAGNQSGIDSYTTLNLVKPNGVVPVGNSAVVSLGDLRNTNPDLKWEVKHTFNTGSATACCFPPTITTPEPQTCFTFTT